MTVDVGLIDAESFRPIIATAAHIYGSAMQRPPELVVQRREIMQAHLHRPGFTAVLATDPQFTGEEAIVGFGYGYRGRGGEWWHDVVTRALSRGDARHWMSDAFELAELHVRPAQQHRGIGRRMLELLVDRAESRTVILSTFDHESPARALYRSAGFVDLLRGFVFPGSAEVYAVMGLDRRPQPHSE